MQLKYQTYLSFSFVYIVCSTHALQFDAAKCLPACKCGSYQQVSLHATRGGRLPGAVYRQHEPGELLTHCYYTLSLAEVFAVTLNGSD